MIFLVNFVLITISFVFMLSHVSPVLFFPAMSTASCPNVRHCLIRFSLVVSFFSGLCWVIVDVAVMCCF